MRINLARRVEVLPGSGEPLQSPESTAQPQVDRGEDRLAPRSKLDRLSNPY